MKSPFTNIDINSFYLIYFCVYMLTKIATWNREILIKCEFYFEVEKALFKHICIVDGDKKYFAINNCQEKGE